PAWSRGDARDRLARARADGRWHLERAGVHRHRLSGALLPPLSPLSALLPADGARTVPRPARRRGGRAGMSVGIERLAAYVPQYALRLEDLAIGRGVPPERYARGLGLREITVPAHCDDTVTLAATAGARVLRAANASPRSVGLLVVATETAVDGAKPVASFVQELRGVGPHCRVFELKHTSYGGTAAVMAAADWIRAGGPRDRRALVIAADITRAAIGSPGEPTQGAAAVAMLMEPQPRAVVLSEETGLHTASVRDEPTLRAAS